MALMSVFPPWQVEARCYLKTWCPVKWAGDYRFIALPRDPSLDENLIGDRIKCVCTEQVDIIRLAIQWVVLTLLTGGVIIGVKEHDTADAPARHPRGDAADDRYSGRIDSRKRSFGDRVLSALVAVLAVRRKGSFADRMFSVLVALLAVLSMAVVITDTRCQKYWGWDGLWGSERSSSRDPPTEPQDHGGLSEELHQRLEAILGGPTLEQPRNDSDEYPALKPRSAPVPTAIDSNELHKRGRGTESPDSDTAHGG